MVGNPVTVFFSYSHKDEALRDELAKHLESLRWSGEIADWHDRRILPGDEWDREIKDNLNTAQIILLLISADFIASSYCRDIEIKRAMERHEAGEARVIPIILRSCIWSSTPFSKLQALPKNARPVTDARTWLTQDDAFTDIAKGIRKAASDFHQKSRLIKLKQYEAACKEAIRQKYPFDKTSKAYLTNLEKSLGLSKEDTLPIIERLIKSHKKRVKSVQNNNIRNLQRTGIKRKSPALSKDSPQKLSPNLRVNNSESQDQRNRNYSVQCSPTVNFRDSFPGFLKKTFLLQAGVIISWLIAASFLNGALVRDLTSKLIISGSIAGIVSGLFEGLALKFSGVVTKKEEIFFKYPLVGLLAGGVGWSITGSLLGTKLMGNSNGYWIGLLFGMMTFLTTVFYFSQLRRSVN